MSSHLKANFYLFLALVITGTAAPATKGTPLPYRDSSLPLKIRIDDLIGRMTLEEKVGQLNMPCVYEGGLGRGIEEKMSNVKKFAMGTLVDGLGPGGGFFTLPNTILHNGTSQQVEFINELQKIALEKTRLGIPLLLTEEGTHGLMCSGGTIFPEGPALGSTWNLDLISRIYSATAKEARSIGIHQIFTLVIEPIRDPRLGRNEEAYSEDSYLCSRYAETIVRSVQGDDVSQPDKCVAGLCHYPGQSEPVSGLERGAMEISERKLREVFLPSWEAGIKYAGALGVMATYPTIDGIPAHASEWILTDILRGEFGFEGLVLCEGGGIETVIYQGLAPDMKCAGQIAIKAGVDVGISYESGYMLDLIQSVKDGAIPESLVDRALRRVLLQKFKLGLFENPYVELENAEKTVHNPEHQDIALEAARQSIVLLKNEGNLLPLDRTKIKNIAVIGPNADDEKNQLGDYVAINVLQDIVTVLDGVKTLAQNSEVTYVKGCNVTGTKLIEIDEARDAAQKADVAIVVLGENEWRKHDQDGEHVGTSGEGFDAATLELTGLQQRLVETVYQTGTPTVVVLINGRPLAIRWIAENIPAVIEAWIPGEKGGQAVAEILFGDIYPSGKLPVTIPRHAGQLPVYYNYQKPKRHWLQHAWGKPYVDMDPSPLFVFGHGLSYTSFKYSNLVLDKKEILKGGTVKLNVDILNDGLMAGTETIQLYIEDIIATVSTPVLELRGFQRVELKPGETKTIFFELGPRHLELYDRHLDRVVEPGEFSVKVGASSADIRLEGRFVVK
ncbi:glycoside hydrolase family 3 C-terminal domain-containing protein [candidate division KSB1 bacterium]|nr:glycoside hydrolase family 3 C-terminal domain-containing protein [candidate division KSB1 bacterium]